QQHSRSNLVTVRDTDHRVSDVSLDHILDAVGDQFATRQGIQHTIVAHSDAVIYGDSVELHAIAPVLINNSFDLLADIMEMHMAGHELGKRIGDGNNRLLKIFG